MLLENFPQFPHFVALQRLDFIRGHFQGLGRLAVFVESGLNYEVIRVNWLINVKKPSKCFYTPRLPPKMRTFC